MLPIRIFKDPAPIYADVKAAFCGFDLNAERSAISVSHNSTILIGTDLLQIQIVDSDTVWGMMLLECRS